MRPAAFRRAIVGFGVAGLIALPDLATAAEPAPSYRRFDPSLVLRLSTFRPPPARAATASSRLPERPTASSRPGGIVPPGSPGLALRLLGWDGPVTPPAADDAVPGFVESLGESPPGPPPVAGAAPPAPLSEGSSRPAPPVLAFEPEPLSPRPEVEPVPVPVPEPLPGLGAEPTRLAAEGAPPSPSGSSGAGLPPAAVPDGALIPERAPALTLPLGHSRRLRLDRDATAVLVASPEIADVRLLSPRVLYVIGKGIGRTSVAVLGGREWLQEWEVSIERDLEPLRTILAGESDLREVRATRLSRGVALTGEVASVATADRALRLAAAALPEGVPVENELRVAAPQQVNLEVQIAEVHRSATEHLGISWEAFRQRGSELFGFRIGRTFFEDSNESVPFVPFLPAQIDGSPSSSIAFGRETARTRIAGMIDALATAGLANVLARPNVTAVSGETASFFSGGEYPLPVGFEDGVILFEYKKFGVLLDFVPTVVDSGRIVLTVRPEVSEPSRSQSVQVVGTDIPVINVRRAETTVEVGDGESIVIAGLFRTTSNTAESGVPGLKDLPLLGVLFGQTATRSEELELIVVVTARLVRPGPSPDFAAGTPPATGRVHGYHY